METQPTAINDRSYRFPSSVDAIADRVTATPLQQEGKTSRTRQTNPGPSTGHYQPTAINDRSYRFPSSVDAIADRVTTTPLQQEGETSRTRRINPGPSTGHYQPTAINDRSYRFPSPVDAIADRVGDQRSRLQKAETVSPPEILSSIEITILEIIWVDFSS